MLRAVSQQQSALVTAFQHMPYVNLQYFEERSVYLSYYSMQADNARYLRTSLRGVLIYFSHFNDKGT